MRCPGGARAISSAALSFGLLAARGSIPDVFSIEIANGLLLLGYGFLLAGTRAFSGRETPATAFLIAPLVWLTAMQVPAIASDINLRVVIVSSMQCTFVLLMAYEFWRERAEPLLSRWPTIFVLCTHAVILPGRMISRDGHADHVAARTSSAARCSP